MELQRIPSLSLGSKKYAQADRQAVHLGQFEGEGQEGGLGGLRKAGGGERVVGWQEGDMKC